MRVTKICFLGKVVFLGIGLWGMVGIANANFSVKYCNESMVGGWYQDVWCSKVGEAVEPAEYKNCSPRLGDSYTYRWGSDKKDVFMANQKCNGGAWRKGQQEQGIVNIYMEGKKGDDVCKMTCYACVVGIDRNCSG